jgi:glucose 1-dehydrogenase
VDGLAKTASELVRPNDLRAVPSDVAKRADVDRLVATATKEFGRIDIMANNAGVARHQDLLEISEKDFDDVIAINLKGAFFGVQAAAKQMIAQGGGGVIINVSSVNALLAIPSLATYALSKGGMKQLTSVAAVALAPHKIRVVAVGPGTILTDKLAVRLRPRREALGDTRQVGLLTRSNLPLNSGGLLQLRARRRQAVCLGTIDGRGGYLDVPGSPGTSV